VAIKMVEGEVLWLDIRGGSLNVKDAKGSVHITLGKKEGV
jgi:hypothetical protein